MQPSTDVDWLSPQLEFHFLVFVHSQIEDGPHYLRFDNKTYDRQKVDMGVFILPTDLLLPPKAI